MEVNDICFVIVVFEPNSDLIITLDSIELEQPFASVFIKSASYISEYFASVLSKYKLNLSFESSSDKGIYDAWNQSLKNKFVLKHSYITFFGAGDILNAGAYHNYIKSIEYLDFDVLTSKSIDVFENGDSIVNGKPMDCKMFQKYFCINHTGVLYKTGWIMSRKFNTTFKSSGDYAFLLEHLDDTVFEFLDYPVSTYPVGGISSSSTLPIFESFRARYIFSNITLIENIYLFIKAFLGFYIKHWRK